MVVVEFSYSLYQNLNTERKREGGRDGISSKQLAMPYELSIDLTVITISLLLAHTHTHTLYSKIWSLPLAYQTDHDKNWFQCLPRFLSDYRLIGLKKFHFDNE